MKFIAMIYLEEKSLEKARDQLRGICPSFAIIGIKEIYKQVGDGKK